MPRLPLFERAWMATEMISSLLRAPSGIAFALTDWSLPQPDFGNLAVPVEAHGDVHVLTAVEHVDTFWFAWAAFLPRTRVIGGEGA